MAGGTRRDGMTLEQRSRLSGIGRNSSHRRHCWVTGPDEDPGPWPGLILDWQHTEAGWRAWVIYVIGQGQDFAIQGWIERSCLKPTD